MKYDITRLMRVLLQVPREIIIHLYSMDIYPELLKQISSVELLEELRDRGFTIPVDQDIGELQYGLGYEPKGKKRNYNRFKTRFIDHSWESDVQHLQLEAGRECKP